MSTTRTCSGPPYRYRTAAFIECSIGRSWRARSGPPTLGQVGWFDEHRTTDVPDPYRDDPEPASAHVSWRPRYGWRGRRSALAEAAEVGVRVERGRACPSEQAASSWNAIGFQLTTD